MSQDLGRVTGLSAFEVWQKQPGNSGKNEEQFFASLKGAKGDPGQQGAKGETGATGAKGEPGTPGARGEKGEPGTPGQNGQTPQISMRIDERGHLMADITYR